MTEETEEFIHQPMVFVGVSESGKLIYVGIEKRTDFDRIEAEMTDNGQTENGRVLVKTVEQAGVRVIFQYWLNNPSIKTLTMRRMRRAAEQPTTT